MPGLSKKETCECGRRIRRQRKKREEESKGGEEESDEEEEEEMQPEEPSPAEVGISLISVPLAWNRDQHFKNKGEYQTFTLFVTLRCIDEVVDSRPIPGVDRTVTDVVFPDAFVFRNQPDDFCVEVSVCAARTDDALLAAGASGGSIRARLTRSLGRRLGQATKKSLTVGESALRAALPTAPESLGASSYNLLGRTLLASTDAGDQPLIHDLKTRAFADLCGPPLYGSIVCRLSVRPVSVAAPIAEGVLSVTPEEPGATSCELVHARLQAGRLRCYINASLGTDYSAEQTVLEIAVNAGSRVSLLGEGELRLVTASSAYGPGRSYRIRVATASHQAWQNALLQQIADCESWGIFAYKSLPLTKPSGGNSLSTLDRTCGKHFYDQIDVNGTFPRNFFVQQHQFTLNSYSGSMRPASPLSGTWASMSPPSVLWCEQTNNTPSRYGARPSIRNVFPDSASQKQGMAQQVPVSSTGPHFNAIPRPFVSTACNLPRSATAPMSNPQLGLAHQRRHETTLPLQIPETSEGGQLTPPESPYVIRLVVGREDEEAAPATPSRHPIPSIQLHKENAPPTTIFSTRSPLMQLSRSPSASVAARAPRAATATPPLSPPRPSRAPPSTAMRRPTVVAKTAQRSPLLSSTIGYANEYVPHAKNAIQTTRL